MSFACENNRSECNGCLKCQDNGILNPEEQEEFDEFEDLLEQEENDD